jgi:mannitol/fructose-specific phosphotransferase system IIA component (Ntr-type)
MQLSELITDPAQVLTDLQATDRWGAIDELISVLVSTARVSPDNAAAVTAAVREREATMSTGIGHGIGIPHAPTDHVARVEAALGITRRGADFEALDGAPVHIVLLFVVPKNQFQQHLDTLANIARVLSNPQTREQLRDASAPARVLDIIRSSAR